MFTRTARTALTDHDRLDGLDAARRRGRELGIDVVGGCEVSCTTAFGTLHLLAYFVEEDGGPLHAAFERLQQWRSERNARLVARLAELGLPVSLEEMEAKAGDVGVGRPHVVLSTLARRHDLVVTGGSDYHGTYKPGLQVGIGQGDLVVPDEVLADLDARRPSPV